MIMSLYLWHMSILILVFALAQWMGGLGMGLSVGSVDWWLSRPLWLGLLAILLLPLALAVSFLERLPKPQEATQSNLRLILGACLSGLGIALASLQGFNGDPASIWPWSAMILLLLGCSLCGIRCLPKRSASAGGVSYRD